MNALDRVRLESAVVRYDAWLDLRGTPGRRRRDLRRELRSNLRDSADAVGARQAVAALGSTREMATEATPADPGRPRWRSGLQASLSALVLTVFVELLAALAWVDGVMTVGRDRAVSGSVTLFPGSSVTYAPLGDGFSVTVRPGWLCVAVALLVLVLVARPWRLRGTRVR